MNKNLYCILFNQAKGAWVVVRESALSRGATRYSGCIPMLIRCAGAVLALHPALQAQVVSASNAPPANQPVVATTTNNTPLVQIAAPNAAGLSNNHYHTFDVDERGLILNNARDAALTQLGGTVAGNPFLEAGAARVILNQVVGSEPSHLNGFLEVAGSRADLILANPHGIVCNGGGFINTHRAVLTTGTPLLGADGRLEGFQVNGGQLVVHEKGLKASNLIFLDLITRSLQVHGPIHINGNLTVVTGANRVGYGVQDVRALPDPAPSPTQGIDVARLGGMYAHRIHLIGTEAGVGVHCQGRLSAHAGGFGFTASGQLVRYQDSTTPPLPPKKITCHPEPQPLSGAAEAPQAGNFIAAHQARIPQSLPGEDICPQGGNLAFTQQGKIILRGSATATGTLTIDARDEIINTGSLASRGEALLNSAGTIHNTGAISSMTDLTLRAASVASSGYLGAGLDTLGKAVNEGNLEIVTSGSLSSTGQQAAGSAIAFTGTTLSLPMTQAQAGTSLTLTATTGALDLSGATLRAMGPLRLTAAGALVNDGGQIAADQVELKAASLSNQGGSIAQVGPETTRIAIKGPFLNQGGILASDGRNVHLEAFSLTNDGLGQILHGGTGRLSLQTGALTNGDGLITSKGALAITATQDLTNGLGTIQSDGFLRLQADTFTNDGGKLLSTASGLSLVAEGALRNGPRSASPGEPQGIISAHGAAVIQGDTLDNAGTIQAGPHLNVRARTLTNSGILSATGTLEAEGRASFTNAQGRVSAVRLALTAPELDNSRGTLLADTLQVTSTNLTNTAGTIAQLGTGPMVLKVAGAMTNTLGGVIQTPAIDLRLAPRSLDNSQGTIAHGGDGLLSVRVGSDQGALLNPGGTISTNGTLEVGAGSLDNRGGKLTAQQRLEGAVTRADLDNGMAEGKAGLIGGNEVHLQVAQGSLNNHGGTVEGNRGVTLHVHRLDNGRGNLLNTGKAPLVITAQQSLVNDHGLIATLGEASLQATTLVNQGGDLWAGTDLKIQSGTLENSGTLKAGAHQILQADRTLTNTGTMTAGTRLEASAPTIQNTQGHLLAPAVALKADKVVNSADVTTLALSVTTIDLNNQGGRLNHLGTEPTSLKVTGHLDNTKGGQIQARSHDLDLEPQGLDNRGGTILHAGTGALTLRIGADHGIAVNAGGTIASLGRIELTAASLDNHAGTLVAHREVKVVATEGTIDNHKAEGQTGGISADQVDLTSLGALLNQGGIIEGVQGVLLEVQSLDNQGGILLNTGDAKLQVTAKGQLDNGQGLIGSNGKSVLLASAIGNLGGVMHGGTRLEVTSTAGDLLNRNGILNANAGLEVKAPEGGLANQGGLIAAKQDATVQARSLDNTSGKVLNTGGAPLTVTASQTLNNAKGLIGSNGVATVEAATIENAGGAMHGGTDLTINSRGALLNQDGVLHANANLKATAQGALHNQGGRVEAGESKASNHTLTVTALSVDNSSGQIVNVGAGDTHVEGTSDLINRNAERAPGMGTISGNGNVKAVTAALRNTEGGLLVANAGLTLEAHAHFDNSGGEAHAQGPLNVHGLDATAVNAGGRLSSMGDLKVEVASIDNRGGYLGNTGKDAGTVQLNARNGVCNEQGKVASAQDLTLVAKALPLGGVLGGGRDATYTLQGDYNLPDGQQLTAPRDVTLTTTGTFINHGKVVAPRTVTLQAANIHNQVSGLIHGETAVVTAHNDLITKGGIHGTNLALTASNELVNHGSLDAKGTATLTSLPGTIRHTGTAVARKDLVLRAGAVASSGALSAGVGDDGQANQAGALRVEADHRLEATGEHKSGGTLTFQGAALTMAKARTSAAGAITLTATIGAIDHTGGILRSSGAFTATAPSAALVNDGGQIAAQQVTVTAAGLSNRMGTLAQAGQRESTLKLSGTLDNHGGTLASNATAFILKSGELHNEADGKILHAGTGLLTIETGPIDNARGTLTTNGQATITARSLTNEAGLLSAKGHATIITTEDLTLDNSAGIIAHAGRGTLSLTLPGGPLTNTAGSITSNGHLTAVASSIGNQGGTMVAQGVANVTATQGPIDNREHGAKPGLLGGNKVILEARQGALRNGGSRVEASQGLSITVQSLDNASGTLKNAGEATLAVIADAGLGNGGGNIGSKGPAYVDAGHLDNTKGTIQAGTGLNLQSRGDLLNEGGFLQSNASLTAGAKGNLDNSGARIEAGGAGSSASVLEVAAVSLTNNNGRIVNAGTGDSRITAAKAITNSNPCGAPEVGVISGQGKVTASAPQLHNTLGGHVAAKGDLTLDISEKVVNAGSKLSAQGTLTLDREGAVLDNAGGEIGGGQVNLTVGTLDNTKGRIGTVHKDAGDVHLIAKKDLNNTLGQITSGQDLVVSTPSVTGHGRFSGGRDAELNLQGPLTHPGLPPLTANRNLTLTTTGPLTNAGTLEAPGILTVRASALINGDSGLLAGEATRIFTTGDLTNTGRIYGHDIALGAGKFVNKTGSRPPSGVATPDQGRPRDMHGFPFRRSQAAAAAASSSSSSSASASNAFSTSKAGVVAATQSLHIGAKEVSNLGKDAMLYSAVTMGIGGVLDGGHQASGQADAINNESALIQSEAGDLRLGAATIRNTNPTFATTQEVTNVQPGLVLIKPQNSQRKYRPSELQPTTGDRGLGGCWWVPKEGPGGGYDHVADYHKYTFTRTTVRTVPVPSSSFPGRIFAGRDLDLSSGLTVNDKSRIMAGRHLSFPGGSLKNLDQKGVLTQTDEGSVEYARSEFRGGFRPRRNRIMDQHGAFGPDTETTSFDLHVVQESSGIKPPAPSAPASGPRGGPIAVHAMATAAPLLNAAAHLPGATALPGVAHALAGAVDPFCAGSLHANVAGAEAPSPNLTLPSSHLYRVKDMPGQASVVETDPAFLRGQAVQGLDYMLKDLVLDPGATRLRLGDGFYEKQLVGSQVRDLTGRMLVHQDAGTQAQDFKVLMDNGLEAAKTLHLRPGVPLSATQQSALTQDSVWIVEQQVTMPDGTTAPVLVPVVYLAPGSAPKIRPTGALIAAKTIVANLTGTLENTGNLTAETLINMSADEIHNQGAMRTTGADSDLNLLARKNLLSEGTIQGHRVTLGAGQDLSLRTTTYTSTSSTGSRTGIAQVAQVSADTLFAAAGRDLTLTAAQVQTTGSAALSAVRDLRLEALTTGTSEQLGPGKNHLHLSRTSVHGTQVDGGADLSFKAGKDFIATAAQVKAGADLQATAGGNMTLTTANETSHLDEAHAHTSHGFLSSSYEETKFVLDSGTAIGTTFSGETVTMETGKDLKVHGSTVAGTGDTVLTAGGGIQVEAATSTQSSSSYSHSEERGLLSGGGFGLTVGTREQTDQSSQRTSAQSQNRSLLGSTDGNLSINSAAGIKVSGSDLVARKDVQVTGAEITLDAGRDEQESHEHHTFKQTGLTVALGGGALAQAAGLVHHVDQARPSIADGRTRGLHALMGALDAAALVKSAPALGSALATGSVAGVAEAAGITVSASIGTCRSESESSEHAVTHSGSKAQAGANLILHATKTDLKAEGATLTGENIGLKAARDLELLSAVDTTSSRSSNSSSSASLGVSAGIGPKGVGLSVDASLSGGQGRGQGDSATHRNTAATGQSNLSIESGRDATLAGAQASAQRVQGAVGGNLTLTSLQDTSTYHADQESSGVAVSVPIFGTRGSASVTQSQSNTTGNLLSVGEQTGLRAGEAGFQVSVKGVTTLQGALLASTAAAERNALTTGTVVTTDLDNHSSGSSSTSGFSAGTDMGSLYGAGKNLAGTLATHAQEQASDSSTTHTAIAPGAITVTDPNGQQALDGIRRNIEGTHRALEQPDVAGMERRTQAKREVQTLLFSTIVAYSDQAIASRGKEGARYLRVIGSADASGGVGAGQGQDLVVEEFSEEEFSGLGTGEKATFLIATGPIEGEAQETGPLASHQPALLPEPSSEANPRVPPKGGLADSPPESSAPEMLTKPGQGAGLSSPASATNPLQARGVSEGGTGPTTGQGENGVEDQGNKANNAQSSYPGKKKTYKATKIVDGRGWSLKEIKDPAPASQVGAGSLAPKEEPKPKGFVAGTIHMAKDTAQAAVDFAVHNPFTQGFLQVSDTVNAGLNCVLGTNFPMQSELGQAAERGAFSSEMAVHAVKGPVEVMAAVTAGNVAGRVIGSMLPRAVIAGPKAGVIVVRTTRAGEKAIRISRPDGTMIDISSKRVKEYIPKAHPNAPAGTLDKVQFKDAIPGSKGYKRIPTKIELDLLDKAK
jgi:filamentous hemagglutinin